jgi:N-acylglucosamine 2-epimerase
MQGRAGWAFSYVYNHFEKKAEYLDFARSCIAFAGKCFDTNGRMYNVVTRDGRPIEKTGEFFSETFYIMANAEFYIATGEDKYLAEARRLYDMVYGIYKDPSTDSYKASDNAAPTVRALRPFNRPMILLNVTSLMREADPEREKTYDKNSRELCGVLSNFYRPEFHATLENLGMDWEPVLDTPATRISTPGHDMECAWFLLEEGLRLNDGGVTGLAVRMFDDAYTLGVDDVYGGFVYQKDVLGGPVENYECETKVWWVHNEAIIASLALYLFTGDEAYAEKFARAVEYSFENFVDEDGEWYYALHRNGEPISSRMKGFIYKGPFHTIRMYVKCIELLKMLDKE